MTRNILFKTLIDILFFLQCFGLLGTVFILPTNISTISQANTLVEDWNILHWFMFILSAISYLIFLSGIYFLRKMAKHYLTNNIFSLNSTSLLNKSGNCFILYGALSILNIAIQFINNLFNSKIKLTYDINMQMSVLTLIIGLFFILQSNTLSNAKKLKEENDLTI